MYVWMDVYIMCTFNKNTDIAFRLKVLTVLKQLVHFDIYGGDTSTRAIMRLCQQPFNVYMHTLQYVNILCV